MSNDKPVGTRGVSYLRVSDGEKQNPERQRESIRAWAAKRGLTITEWYEDVQGRNPRDRAEGRPQFQRLLQDVQAGRLDWVIVDSQDRFGVKDQFEFGYYAHILRQHDCQLWSVGQGLLTSTDDAAVFTTTVGNVTSGREQREKGQRAIGDKRRRSALGEWQGGYVPYGYDVACVDRSSGVEQWRVVIIQMIPEKGIWNRVIIWPDGRQERRDGKGVFPRHDTWEKLVLCPSIITDRVTQAKEVFRLFASGSWTVRGFCDRLNKQKVDPVNGEGWYPTRLTPLLQNPVYYVGATVYGKNSHGRHAWYVGGEFLVPPRVKGKPKAGRHNDPKDWVFPPAGEALIDKTLWDAVQARLTSTEPMVKRGVRDDRLWLSGLLVCGKCRKPMTGWSQGGPHYACTTYRKFGKENPTGCRLHRVRHDTVVHQVKRYLKGVGPDVKALLSSHNNARHLFDRLFWETVGCEWEIDAVYDDIRAFLKPKVDPSRLEEYSRNELVDAYIHHFDLETKRAREALRRKERHLNILVTNLNAIPETARDARRIQGELIAQADREIQELRGQMKPLTERLEGLAAELEALDRDLSAAQAAMEEEDSRRKAFLLRKVLRQVVLNFECADRPPIDRRSKCAMVSRTRIASMQFVPLTGDQRTFTAPTSPGPG
jgi:site-specific DNA recombinase